MTNGLRNYTVTPIDASLRTQCDDLFRTMDHYTTTPTPCVICTEPTRVWACGTCRRTCPHPDSHTVTGWVIRTNGTRQAWARCTRCGRMTSPLPRGSIINDLCLRDNLDRYQGHIPPCERCGSNQGTETHHWAPQAIFADAHDWPTAELCRACHALWHHAMRTVGGISLTTRVHAAPPDAA